jgi:hypothetical protein
MKFLARHLRNVYHHREINLWKFGLQSDQTTQVHMETKAGEYKTYKLEYICRIFLFLGKTPNTYGE